MFVKSVVHSTVWMTWLGYNLIVLWKVLLFSIYDYILYKKKRKALPFECKIFIFPSRYLKFPSRSLKFPSRYLKFPFRSLIFPSRYLKLPFRSLIFPSRYLKYPFRSLKFPSRSLKFPFRSENCCTFWSLNKWFYWQLPTCRTQWRTERQRSRPTTRSSTRTCKLLLETSRIKQHVVLSSKLLKDELPKSAKQINGNPEESINYLIMIDQLWSSYTSCYMWNKY